MNVLAFRTILSFSIILFLPLRAASPGLLVPVPGNDGITLRWNGGTETAFTLQTRDFLDDDVWVPAPSMIPWPISASNWTDTRSRAATRFYRVLGVQPSQRGKILSATEVARYSSSFLGGIFQIAEIPLVPANGVVVHKLVYETIDPWGGRTQASGVVVLPLDSTRPLPLASYQHGTMAKKTEAPSADSFGETVIGLAFAATGYVGVLPDYLGLGDSPGIQPYHHARSEGTAGIDMLRAARQFCQNSGVQLNGQLFLAGYSHGGHATMALLREIETYHASEFTVTAAAPMAGAYDLSGVTLDDFLSGRPAPNPYYAALLLSMVQEVYHPGASLGSNLVEPYSRSLPPLLDGRHTGDEIDGVMPVSPVKIIRPEIVEAIRQNPRHPLRAALRDNDVYHWAPKSPVRMFHCLGDQDVIFANSQIALASFKGLGSTTVELVDMNPGANHSACSKPSLLAAKAWFDSLKK